ncbi:MAG: 4Fe-4S binding protein [Acidimicrobiales bacterium]
MDRFLILGSGPAAVGTALALTARGIRPTVVDLGLRLEDPNAAALARMAASPQDRWADDDVALLTTQPIESLAEGLPEKRAYGSDFPFRDLGQLEGITAGINAHAAVVSPAYGGFSNVWGAQVMPFSRATFERWPFSLDDMVPHYRAILDEMPFAGIHDDLADDFPLLRAPSPLPPLSERTTRTLARYGRRRDRLQRRGVRLGQARLAVDASRCILCGLCMTGCPRSLIYSASQTLDRLRSEGLIEYLPGRWAVRLREGPGGPSVTVRHLETATTETLAADRVFVACGAMGSTRLVAGSLGLFGQVVAAAESAQFTVPFVSRHAIADPRSEPGFTLNQFNMVIDAGDQARDLSQVHFYTYNPAFVDALPTAFRHPRLGRATTELVRRLSVGIGYLPSWASPRLGLRFEGSAADPDGLPRMVIDREAPRWAANPMLRRVLWRLVQVAPDLDLWPVLPKTIFAAGAKSYHFGSTFPHAERVSGSLCSDRLGRVGDWRDIHLVDASVFPDVPATTFTFTIMANAHRIASEVLDGSAP